MITLLCFFIKHLYSHIFLKFILPVTMQYSFSERRPCALPYILTFYSLFIFYFALYSYLDILLLLKTKSIFKLCGNCTGEARWLAASGSL